MLYDDVGMIVEMSAHTGEIMDGMDACCPQIIGRANSRQEQNLWGVDCSAADNDFRFGPRLRDPTSYAVGDSNSAAFDEQDPMDQCRSLRREPGPAQRRPQIRARGAPTTTVACSAVNPAKAFLLLAIHVLGQRIAGLRSCAYKCGRKGSRFDVGREH